MRGVSCWCGWTPWHFAPVQPLLWTRGNNQSLKSYSSDSPTWGGSTGPAVRSGPFSGGLSSGFSPGSFREVPPAGSQCRQRPLVGSRVLRGVRYPGAARTRRFSSMCRADKQYWERSLIVMDYLVITSILFSLNEWNTPFLPSLCQSLMQDN